MNLQRLVTGLFQQVKDWIDPQLEEIKGQISGITELQAIADKSIQGIIERAENIPIVPESRVLELVKESAPIPYDESGLKAEIEGLAVVIESLKGDLAAIKAQLDQIQIPEPVDLSGIEGKLAEIEEQSEKRWQALEAIEIPKAFDPSEIMQEIEELKQMPKPIDGKDGLDIEILPQIPEKSVPRGTYAYHKGGIWKSHAQTHGMAGWSCVTNGVADISVDMLDERTFQITVTDSNGKEYGKQFEVPVMQFKGVWKEGSYKKGDSVTRFGSIWTALEDTDESPGDGKTSWQLSVKRGRDGSNGKA